MKKAATKQFFNVRYVDDTFVIWEGNQEQLLGFHKIANSVCEQIKVDLRQSTVEPGYFTQNTG